MPNYTELGVWPTSDIPNHEVWQSGNKYDFHLEESIQSQLENLLHWPRSTAASYIPPHT